MDMEWNQVLTFSEMVKDPVFLTGEIIQIGAIKLNQTLEVVDSFNERIAPQYYTELHPKVLLSHACPCAGWFDGYPISTSSLFGCNSSKSTEGQPH